MPSMDAPTYYEHSDGIAPGRADAFLKSIDPDFYVADTGDVESPLGHVALVKVSRDMIAEYVSREGDPWLSERRNFAPGWYIIRTDSNGLVWGISYGGWCDMHQDFCADTFEELKARQDFAEAEAVYAEWSVPDCADPGPDCPIHGGACD